MHEHLLLQDHLLLVHRVRSWVVPWLLLLLLCWRVGAGGALPWVGALVACKGTCRQGTAITVRTRLTSCRADAARRFQVQAGTVCNHQGGSDSGMRRCHGLRNAFWNIYAVMAWRASGPELQQ
jgi:hypothetical protein